MIEQIKRALTPVAHCQRFVVALSGGLDSTALLHLVATCFPEKTHAVHINHGLSPNADAWATECARVCDHLSVPFHCREVDAMPAPGSGDSPEEAARTARYAALAEFIDEQSCLLTAHNLDDQAETVLLQLFRGAGPKGLSAMPEVTAFGVGWHARPLLQTTRAQLEDYVREQELSWVEDESNVDTRFNRNFIRHQVLPVIKQRWPQVEVTVGRSAKHCAESAALLDVLAAQDLQAVRGQQVNSLSARALRGLGEAEQGGARQRAVLRYWLSTQGFVMPSTKQLEQVVKQMIYASPDARPHFRLPEYEVRRFRDEVVVDVF